MIEAPLELSLILRVTDGRSVDDLSGVFYERFEGVLSQRLGQTFAMIRRDGQDGLSTAVEIVLQLENDLAVQVVGVDWDLVDMTEIAVRMEVTTSNVHQFVTGQRAEGSFPRPFGAPSGHRVWSWAAVNEWIRRRRPRSWSGVRTLTESELRWLDGWLVQREPETEHLSRSRLSGLHRAEVSALTSEFLRVQWMQGSAGATSTATSAVDVVVETLS